MTTAATVLALIGGPSTPVVQGVVSAAGTSSALALPASPSTYTVLARYGSSVARWNPCAPVPWVFNPANAPAGGLTVVRAAFARVSALSGLQFQYLGTSRTVPSSAYPKQSWGSYKPLLVGWSTASASDLLAGTGVTHVGETRMRWVGLQTPSGLKAELASGVVVFNARSAAPLWGPGSRYTYALHELGHAVGLSHVATSRELMGFRINGGLRDYGTGDRAGLLRVGTRAGCLPAIR